LEYRQLYWESPLSVKKGRRGMRRATKPDAQPFDEVQIVTIPRYKTSELSGDEWRISAEIRLIRNGRTIHEERFSDVATAIQFLPSVWRQAIDRGLGYFAGEGDICDQEGCSEKATVTYLLKGEYCNFCAAKEHYYDGQAIRKFCARHSIRGDCGIDDADKNYELIEGDTSPPHGEDESPSAFGGIVDARL